MKKDKRVYDGFVKVDIVNNHLGAWEVVRASDAVVILIHDLDSDSVILVRQPRAPMQSETNPQGMMLEAPAGRFDYKATPVELAINEVKEETGLSLNKEDVTILNNGLPLATSPGVLSEKAYLCFAEVHLGQVDHSNNHFNHGRESIERVFVPVSEFRTMPLESAKLFALREWFFANIYTQSTV